MGQKYLSNSELLFELNRSKKTFCSFNDKELFGNYDYIVDSLSEINDETIEQAKLDRVKRIKANMVRNMVIACTHNYSDAKKAVKTVDVPVTDTDVVFRVMTFEHIPDRIIQKATRTHERDYYEKVNFPPFKHYVLESSGTLDFIEVGRSHWKGSIEQGEFSTEHGRITPKLAMMFMKLVDRYSKKPNWNGYSYLDEMQANALLQLTAASLKFNEAKSDNPFAYFTTVVTRSFTGTLNAEKRHREIRDEIIMQQGLAPSTSKQVDTELAYSKARDEAINEGTDVNETIIRNQEEGLEE